jgi:hypothetical protein
VRRGGAIEGPPGPILVATRNDVLDDIVDRTPPDRRKGGLVARRLAWTLWPKERAWNCMTAGAAGQDLSRSSCDVVVHCTHSSR